MSDFKAETFSFVWSETDSSSLPLFCTAKVKVGFMCKSWYQFYSQQRVTEDVILVFLVIISLPFSTCRRRRSSSDSFPSEGTRRRLIWQGDNLRRGKCQVVWFWQETVENVTITIRPDTKCWVLTGQNSDLWQIMNNDIIFYWIKCFFMDSFWYNVMFWMFVRLLGIQTIQLTIIANEVATLIQLQISLL